MMRIFFISILPITLFFGCGQSTEKEKKPLTENKEELTIAKEEEKPPKKINRELTTENGLTFDEYLSEIPETKLPLNFTCEDPLDGSTLNFDQETIATFGCENSRINGKIAVTDEFTAIIYLYPADIVLPIIQTTDLNGNKISELKVFESGCGEDEFYWGTAWAKISENLTITVRDSSIIYKRNNEGAIIEESKKTEVNQRRFQIDNKGLISEIKNVP